MKVYGRAYQIIQRKEKGEWKGKKYAQTTSPT